MKKENKAPEQKEFRLEKPHIAMIAAGLLLVASILAKMYIAFYLFLALLWAVLTSALAVKIYRRLSASWGKPKEYVLSWMWAFLVVVALFTAMWVLSSSSILLYIISVQDGGLGGFGQNLLFLAAPLVLLAGFAYLPPIIHFALPDAGKVNKPVIANK